MRRGGGGEQPASAGGEGAGGRVRGSVAKYTERSRTFTIPDLCFLRSRFSIPNDRSFSPTSGYCVKSWMQYA